jgi:hypothetical protein
MNLRTLLLLKLVCCGGTALLLLVPWSIFAAATALLDTSAWPLAAAGPVAGIALWRIWRRPSPLHGANQQISGGTHGATCVPSSGWDGA